MALKSHGSPDWPGHIQRLLRDFRLTQAGLAERLGVSPATVSRWAKGKIEPTAQTYIALGNLAHPPDNIYFWERAGMDLSSLAVPGIGRTASSLRVNLTDFHLIASAKISRALGAAGNAVAVPLLNVTAWGDCVSPHQNVSLSQAEIETILVAPLDWCPHPEHMVAMHLAGDSMDPVIPPGSIVFVDSAITDRDRLHQKLAVVMHRDQGFKIARFQRLQGTDLMVSANRRCLPLDVSNASRWKVFGEVLWWIVRDTGPTT